MTGVPASHYHRLKQRAEKDAVLARERQVTPRIVYETRPSPATLFAPPISFAYDRHSGPVHEVQFSPFHRNLFLSVASDSTARLYSLLQLALHLLLVQLPVLLLYLLLLNLRSPALLASAFRQP